MKPQRSSLAASSAAVLGGRLPLSLLFLLPAAVRSQVPQASADEQPPVVRAERLRAGESIRLNGTLSEAAWERALPASGFRQQEPREGAPAREATEVRVVYDDDNLYIGAVLHDSNPEGIVAFQKERDASLSTDDRFMWVLDPFGQGRSGYEFETNPAGLMGDGLLDIGGGSTGVNTAWDGIWEVRVSRGASGWTAEIRIPFRTLNFNPAVESWGINFQRTVRRTNEETVWSGYRRNQGLLRTKNAGRLAGLTGISQGLGLQAKVSLKGEASQAPATGAPNWTVPPADVGMDLTYSVTPNLRASVTVNTDFAETEVDQRQVNLTRFPLFFPEKRDFFVEGSAVFNFARPIIIYPYFSRSMGLVGGEEVPIRAGGRLAGQMGNNDLGLLQIRTGPGAGSPGEDFTAARIVRKVLNESSVGVLYTRRAGYTDDPRIVLPADRHTVGLDYDLFTSRFRRNRNLQLHGFLLWNSDPNPAAPTTDYDRSSFGSRLSYTSSALTAYFSARRSGKAFSPAVGFTPRNNFRHFEPLFRYTLQRPDSRVIRNFSVFSRTLWLTDDDALRTQSVNSTFTPMDIQFVGGARASLQTRWNYERLDKAFTISKGVVIPPDNYQFPEVEASASLPEHWRIGGQLILGTGEFWAGHHTYHSGSLIVRPTVSTSLAPGWERSTVDLPWGSFSTTVARLRGSWAITTKASMLGIAQYDNVSKVLGLFYRLRWILKPGNDLYFVYVHNWTDAAGSMETMSRRAATKLTFTQRF